MEENGLMNVRKQNILLTVICVILFMIVLALLVWLWFGEQIEQVDHQLKNLGEG